MTLIIRTESENDHNQVYDVNYIAFENRDDEAKLVERIRNSPNFIPHLSIVADLDGEIVGHLLISKAAVRNGDSLHEVLVLAPIAVKPHVQKQGIGSQLIHEGLDRCKELGFHIVMLIGHPTYYPKFGFKPARNFGFELKQFEVPDDVFMVCELKQGELHSCKGELIYPTAFFGSH